MRTGRWSTTSRVPPATAVDTIVETELGPIRFIDTAGMRRKAKIDEETEYYSFVRALKAIDGGDVALLVIDSHRRRHPPGSAPGRARRRCAGVPSSWC